MSSQTLNFLCIELKQEIESFKNSLKIKIPDENKESESLPDERSTLAFNSIYSESLNSKYHYNKGKQVLEESECVNISIGVDR